MGFPPFQFLKACHMGSSRIKVMTVEGRCFKYVAPIIVKEVLMDHPLCALFDSQTVRKHGNRAPPLQASLSLQPGHIYFLIPQPSCGNGMTSMALTSLPSGPARQCSTHTRKVTFAEEPMHETSGSTESLNSVASMEGMLLKEPSLQILPSPCDGVIRLKMVVSKKQLAKVLEEGGDCVSMVEGLLSPLLQASRSDARSTLPSSCNDCFGSCSWSPSLESIHESTRCPSQRAALKNGM